MPQTPHNKSTIRADILEAIRSAWPNGVVDMPPPFDMDYEDEDCYLVPIFDKLRDRLSAIKGATLTYERASDGTLPYECATADRMLWDDDSWETEHSEEPNASYHLFFLGLTDPTVQFETESEEPVDDDDEDSEMELVQGSGTIGCAVAVSLVAPFALITPDQMEQFDNGAYTCPSIDPHIFNMNGGAMDMDDFVRTEHSQEAYDLICNLRNEITNILESLGIAVLPKDEAEKPAPWLKPAESAWIGEGVFGDAIRVRDAFFFRGIC